MNKTEFWLLIAQSKEASYGDTLVQRKYLQAKLMERSIEDILDFENIVADLMDTAYLADLWEAAAIIGCGCSDDGFMDFRAWLIQQGEKVYHEALLDPEVLVDFVDDPMRTQDGSIWALAGTVYEEKTGQDFLGATPKRPLPELDGHLDNQGSKFPKLRKKFGKCT